MLDANLLQSLPELPAPVLTAYLDINPANPRNQGHPPGYLIWLKSRARVLRSRIPQVEQKVFWALVEQAEETLRNRPFRERGLILFAGPEIRHVLPVQVAVEDELHWGRPSLTQLLWLLDEHQACGAALVDRAGARFFRFWLGAAEEQQQHTFRVDTREWRQKHLVPPGHPGAQKTRGSQRDVFEQRVEAQYDRFYRDVGGQIRAWAEQEKLVPVFLVGPNEVVEAVWGELPKSFQERAAILKGDLSRLSLAELQARLQPEIEAWRRAHELVVVESMLSTANGTRAIVGLDETLERLQQGQARELVVARGLGGRLRQCSRCNWVSRSADRACPACGSPLRAVPLRAVLPELARRYAVPVEVVAGEAGEKLRAAGGLGAWLR